MQEKTINITAKNNWITTTKKTSPTTFLKKSQKMLRQPKTSLNYQTLNNNQPQKPLSHPCYM
jgi:hypothetical protein